MEHLEEITRHSSHIRGWTRRDPILAIVYQYVLGNWPTDIVVLEEQKKV